MKTSELNYIKEITGLTTEAELKTKAQQPSAASVSTTAPRKDLREDTNLQQFVGKPARVGGRYGLVDEVCCYGLGFVSGCENEWTGSVVAPSEVEVLSEPEDVFRAITSARWYFTNEIESLEGRVRRNLPNDNKERLQGQLNHCRTWYGKLAV